MKTVVLGFDIERAGPTDDQNTIAIGASVVDENLTQLDSMEECGYFEGTTQFEEKCGKFWRSNKNALDKLKYTGTSDQYQREAEMVCLFLDFRLKWEKLAEEKGFNLELVSDNNVFDGGFINQMLFEHTDHLPIPFTVKDKKWGTFWETLSEQRGLLIAVNPDFQKTGGFGARINKLYDVPKSTVKYDHTPANDAFNIARDQQVLLGIRNGVFKLNIDTLREVIISDKVKQAEEAVKQAEETVDELLLEETGEEIDITAMLT
jgi:hypothetical protein